jgi:hypothetical protein
MVLRSANGRTELCQYTSRCPVGQHRPGTICPYAGRQRGTQSIPNMNRTPKPSWRDSPRNVPSRRPERRTAPKRPPQRQEPRRIHRNQNRQALLESTTDAAAEVAVTYLFKPGGVYDVVADRLLDKTKMQRRFGRSRGHWLCVVLNDAARSCETGTYIDLVAQGVEKGLREAYGMPRVVAKVFAQCAGTSVKLLLAPTVFVPSNFPIVLRGLIALVCPNLERCPTQADVRTALLSPFVADSLRLAVAGASPGSQSRPASPVTIQA